MIEFKPKTEYRKIPVKIKCPHCESEQNAHIEITPLFGSYVHVCGNCNYVIGESEWNQIEEVNLESVISHYNELLHTYTTTRAELESVKAELAKAKRTVSDLHVGIKEILYNLEDAKQDLKEANKYMLEAAKLNP